MTRISHNAYEEGFAEFLGRDHAFAFWKGRVALYAILRGLDIGEGDEVLVPGYTCVMNVNPIHYVGATPVYVDIEPVTYNLDPALLASKITPRTKAIIAQHTYGYPAAMDEILALARERNIAVIEDCCLALGSKYRGRMVGTFGVAAYFSSQWNKPYTTGLGGMAVTSDERLAERIAALREEGLLQPSARETAMLRAQLAVYRTLIYPRTTALATRFFRWLTHKGLVVGSSDNAEYAPRMADDFFKGMSVVQMRAGRRQLRKLNAGLAHRGMMKNLYSDLLKQAGWRLPELPSHLDPVLVRYPVRVADKNKALATAASHFVELGSWFECPLHPIETPLAAYAYTPGMCPVAERACLEVVNLPMHPRSNANTARRSVNFLGTIGPAVR